METKTKLKLDSVVVQHGQQPFHNICHLIATVEGTLKGTVQVKLKLEWSAGAYSFGRKTRLGLDTEDWEEQKRLKVIGIHRMDEIAGLKVEAMRVAKQFRDTFKPTEKQVEDMANGHLDSQFTAAVVSSNKVSIAFKNLAYGSWQFEGQALLFLEGGEISVTINERGHYGSHLMWLHGTSKENYMMPEILDSAKTSICEYIKPAANRWFYAKATALHAKAVEEVEKELKYRREELERHRRAITSLEKEVADTEQKLASLNETRE